jgi:hypothetical protein
MNFIYSSPKKTSKEKKISFENSKEKMLKGKFNNDIQQERDNDNFGNEISEFCLDDIEEEKLSEKKDDYNIKNPKSDNFKNLIGKINI